MTFSQIIRIISVNRFWELIAFSSLVVLGALAINLIPVKYTATAAIYVDVRSADPLGGAPAPGSTATGYVATQVDILKSESVAQKVFRELNLSAREDVKESWKILSDDNNKTDTQIIDHLLKGLEVAPSRESSLISLSYSDKDPKLAFDIANAFVKSFLDISLELKRAPALQYATWFESQVQESRTKLAQAQDRLSKYQQDQGVIPSDDRIDVELSKLNELNIQATRLQANAAESSGKKSASNDSISDIINSTVVNSLKLDIAKLDASMKEKSANLGPNHPQMIRSQEELESMKRRLQQETALLQRSVDTSFQVAKRGERELALAINAQRTRVLELNRQRDELTILKRDIESAQRSYEAVTQRATQNRLESLSSQTNVVSLGSAAIPTKPAKSKSIYYLILIIAATIFSVAIGFLLEMLKDQIMSVDELGFALGLPVIGSIGNYQNSSGSGKRQYNSLSGPLTAGD